MYIIYKQNLYNNKEKEVYYLFPEYLVPVMDNIEHPALIEEWEQNIDANDYEKSIQRCKVAINKEKN